MKHKALLLLALFILSNAKAAITAFSFDSSPSSWVGQGDSYTITENDSDYLIRLQSTSNSYFSMLVASLNSPFGPDWNPEIGEPYNYWTIEFAALAGSTLGVGTYLNTARYPFQESDQPGLTFSGNHRGNNQNGGFFEVLEVGFDEDGNINRFAADFTQYGENNPDWWTTGQVRLNSTIPIPEPVVPMLLGIAFLLNFVRRKRMQNRLGSSD